MSPPVRARLEAVDGRRAEGGQDNRSVLGEDHRERQPLALADREAADQRRAVLGEVQSVVHVAVEDQRFAAARSVEAQATAPLERPCLASVIGAGPVLELELHLSGQAGEHAKKLVVGPQRPPVQRLAADRHTVVQHDHPAGRAKGRREHVGAGEIGSGRGELARGTDREMTSALSVEHPGEVGGSVERRKAEPVDEAFA